MTGLETRYFVLKPRGKGPYATASRKAMEAYATSITDENPTLAAELRNWVSDERYRMSHSESEQ